MPFGDTWIHDADRPWEFEGEPEPCWNETMFRELAAYLKLTPEERRELECKRDRGGK